MNGMLYAIFIEQDVVGVDWLLLVAVDSCYDTFIVATHIDAWLTLMVVRKCSTYCCRKLRAVSMPYASASPEYTLVTGPGMIPSPNHSLVDECMIHASVPCPWWLTEVSLTRKMVWPWPIVLCSQYRLSCGQILCHMLLAHGWQGVVS